MSIAIKITAVAVKSNAGVVVDDVTIPWNSVVSEVEWDGTLDDRTCPECGMGIGKRYKVGQFRPSLPRHPGCRCFWRDVPPSTKPVPPLMDYKKWIMRQPLRVKQRVFGKEKGKMLEDGIVTLEELRVRRPSTSPKAKVKYKTLKQIKED